jgi:rhomboid family GlyGly-CTERM serine protease
LKPRLPILTFAAAALALLAFSVPGLSHWLVYDREAILDGQCWRLWSWVLCHFSASHLGCDLIPLLIAGWLVETRRCAGYRGLWLVTPPVTGIVVLLLYPEMRYLGGLSGMTTAAVVLMALQGTRARPPWRFVCLAVLLLCLGKLLLEVASGTCFLAATGRAAFEPVPASHIIGAMAAGWFFFSRAHTVATATGGTAGPSFLMGSDLLTRRAAPSAVVDPE